MHRYLQSSGPLFLFRRPVVFGKECKSCLTTFKLPLLQMEQMCLQSKAHSQEQRFHLTPTNPSTRNSVPIPVHHSARETITHSLRVFCTWKSGQIQRYTHKITEVLTQDVGLGYQVFTELKLPTLLWSKTDMRMLGFHWLMHSPLYFQITTDIRTRPHWRNHHCHYQLW